MPEYSVHVETRGPWEEPEMDEAVDRLMAALEEHAGAVAGGLSRMWSATITVSADSYEQAAGRGLVTIMTAAREAGMPAWTVTEVSVAMYGDALEKGKE